MPKSQSKKKNIAEESPKTRRSREKLKQRLLDLDERITDQALQQKSLEIHRWISRHAEHRVPLKNKSIALFDENQNAAGLSQRIAELALRLQK